MAIEKKNGNDTSKLAKPAAFDPTDISVTAAPAAAPEGLELSVAGSSFVGYWRAITGDVLYCVLRGPAPEAVQAKSQSPHGVAMVELLAEAIVSTSKKNLEGRDMKRWVPGPLNKKGEETFLTKCAAGELICVSIREGIKEQMMMPDGTTVWLKVGKIRPVPGSDHTMYDYERYVKAAGAAGSGNAKSTATGGPAIPFDRA